MSREYQQVLPMETTDTVKNQFGWLPLSVFKPERREDLRELVGDDGDETTRRSADAKYLPGLRFSEFHPHLAEMVVKYWSLVGDLVVDPFAGRATRGVIAKSLGREYQGYEVAASTQQKCIAKGLDVVKSDGCRMNQTADASADLVFTCPPYHRIERYENALDQLSDVVDYDTFLRKIYQCGVNINRVLKPGRFLCWVCGDWRDGKAFRVFHSDVLRMFSAIGLTPWDVVVIHNNSPFAPLQAGKVAAKRYTSKTHEYLLVFRKQGDSAIAGYMDELEGKDDATELPE